MAYTAQQIANAIARVESGGNYKARSKTSSASGKYQYIKGTWNNFAGYAEAWMAPPHVQDQRALRDIEAKMKAYGGDIRKVVMSWFLPAAVNNPALASKVPKGNGISPNQYADKVMKALGMKTPLPSASGGGADTGAADTEPADYSGAWKAMDLHNPETQAANLLAVIATAGEGLQEF